MGVTFFSLDLMANKSGLMEGVKKGETNKATEK